VEILRFARKESVDLIVMGSYTIKDPKKAPVLEKPHLGENAQQVTLRARCQVSTITSPKQQLSLKGE
jgi:nucleotide-binding universal stress UspA family protein